MATNYTGDLDALLLDQITLPDDGDDADAESVNDALRDLFDRSTRILYAMAQRQELIGLTGMTQVHSVSGKQLNCICSPVFPSGTTDGFAPTVAVGEDATILTSHAGEPFGAETAGNSFANRFFSVAQHALGTIAVGEDHEIQTRVHNSSTWTQRQHSGGAAPFYSVATANTSGGHQSAVAVAGDGLILTDDDSLNTWTVRTSAFSTHPIMCVKNEGGNSAVYMAVTDTGEIMRSVNSGHTWFSVHTIAGSGVACTVNALTYHPSIGWLCLYSTGGGANLGIARSANGADWVDDTPVHAGNNSHLGGGSVAGIIATQFGVIWPSSYASGAPSSSVGVYWKLIGVDFEPSVASLHAKHILLSSRASYRPAFLLSTRGHFWMLGNNDAGDSAIFSGSTFDAT